jgi:hypothetical protein
VSKRPSVLSEDSQKLYNKWVSGIATRDLQPEVITVADIVNRYRNTTDAPKRLPFPLELALDYLGDIFVKCADFRRQLQNSLVNPVVKDNAEGMKAIRELNKKMEAIQDAIFSCTEQLNKIVEKE